MVKALAKYSLFLSVLLISVLLIGGYCLLSTAYQGSTFSDLVKNGSVHTNFGTIPNSNAVIQASSKSASRHINYQSFAEVNEVEEKESAQSKRHSKESHYLTSFFNTQISAYSFQANITRLSLHKHVSFISSFESRHIQFCDLRI